MCSVHALLVFLILHERVKTHGSSELDDQQSQLDQSTVLSTVYDPQLEDDRDRASFEESASSYPTDGVPCNSLDRNVDEGEKEFTSTESIDPAFSSPDSKLSRQNGAVRTVYKEISNFPVNILKEVMVKSPIDLKSPGPNRVRQMESKTSSVRVVVTRATRKASTLSPEPGKSYEENSTEELSTLRNDKLSSRYRASDLMEKQAMYNELGEECQPSNSTTEKFLRTNLATIKRDTTSGLNITDEAFSVDSNDPEDLIELGVIHNSHLPASYLSLQNVEEQVASPRSKIRQNVDSFQERVMQIRELLKQIESNEDVEEDYDDYDGEDIPAQFKYLTLFEEKYGNALKDSGHVDNSSVHGLNIDFPDDNNMKPQSTAFSNIVPAEEIVPVSKIEDIGLMTDEYVQSRLDPKEFNVSGDHIQARNFPLETPIWLNNNITGKRLPPKPFTKSENTGSTGTDIILNRSNVSNKSIDQNITVSNKKVRPTLLRSANEKLLSAVKSLFNQKAVSILQSNYELSTDMSDINDENLSKTNGTEPTQAQETDSLDRSVIRTNSHNEESKKVNLGQIHEPLNTFLYNYEEDNTLMVKQPDETPLFLDAGSETATSGGEKGRGVFEHFSSNDIDSDQFTSSISNAQIKMYELYRYQHSGGPTMVEDPANSTTDPPAANAMSLVSFQYQESRCFTGSKEGLCFTGDVCIKKGGQIGSNCNFQGLYCCTFTYSCGDMTKERVTYFKSPRHPARPFTGLTCDYDVIIRPDVCAVRLEFEKVNLARKLGGVCDIDQLFILNSIDGPTTGQCGPLSGYATTVAVKGSQIKPLKVALLIQSVSPYYWYIKVIQLSCSHVKNFRAPLRCGRSSMPRTLDRNTVNSWQRKWHRVGRKSRQNAGQDKKKIWWKYPEPILNTYYFSATKRHLRQFHQGTLTRQPRRRIVAGGDAEIGEFPWQVAVALDGMFFCGGALLNEHFVLTAAHCIMTRDTPVSDLVLHIGDHDLTQLNETSHVRRGVRRVLFHSHFHPFVLSNDIALLQLDRPVVFSDTIQPICLPQRGESFIGKRGSVVGWGVTSFPMGEPSPVLQKLEVKVLSNPRCSTVIEESIGIGMMCAAPDETQGTCFGDSGGPLTFEQENGNHVLAGIVSYGVTGCAIMPSYPDLYTRVSEYVRWINVNAIVTK